MKVTIQISSFILHFAKPIKTQKTEWVFRVLKKAGPLSPARNHLGDDQPPCEALKLLRRMEQLLKIRCILFP